MRIVSTTAVAATAVFRCWRSASCDGVLGETWVRVRRRDDDDDDREDKQTSKRPGNMIPSTVLHGTVYQLSRALPLVANNTDDSRSTTSCTNGETNEHEITPQNTDRRADTPEKNAPLSGQAFPAKGHLRGRTLRRRGRTPRQQPQTPCRARSRPRACLPRGHPAPRTATSKTKEQNRKGQANPIYPCANDTLQAEAVNKLW